MAQQEDYRPITTKALSSTTQETESEIPTPRGCKQGDYQVKVILTTQ